MASSQAFIAVVLCLLTFGQKSTMAQPPPVFVAGGEQLCNYQYAIPSGDSCLTYMPALEKNVETMQQDLDRFKLQYFSQNNFVQEQLTRLQQQSVATDGSVADLAKDVQNLQAAIASLQSELAHVTNRAGNGNGNGNGNENGNGGGNPSNAMLQQLVTTTRAQLMQDMQKIENEVNDLEQQRQLDAVQQSQVDAALQAQLRHHEQEINTLAKALENVNIAIQQQSSQPDAPTASVAAPTSTSQASTTKTSIPLRTDSTESPASSAALQQLQADVTQLTSQVNQLEKEIKLDMDDLKKNFTALEQQVYNQSLTVSDVKSEMSYFMVQTSEMDERISTNYGAISQLRQTTQVTVPALQNQVQRIAQNVSSLAAQVTTLGTNSLTMTVEQRNDHQELEDLQVQVSFLSRQLASMKTELNITNPTVPPTTTTRPPVPTPRPRTTTLRPS